MILPLLPYIVLGICALPWLLVTSRRFGAVLGALTVLAATPTLLLLAFLVSPLVDGDPVVFSLAAAGLGGVIGLVVMLRDGSARRAPSRATFARWLPASAGGLVWLLTLAIARLVPGAAVLSWAMNGDGSNNIHLARSLLANHGLTGDGGSTVPLADVLLAVATWAGRAQTPGRGLLEHDLVALSTFWALAIAATGLLLGLVVSSLLEGKRPLVVGIAAGAGSLLVLTFFVTGLPIDSGYLNAHVASPFALAAWLVFLQSRRAPLLTTVLLFGFSFLILTVWSPLVVIPASLIVVLGLRNRARIRVAKTRTAIIIGGAAALAVAYLLLVSLPLLQQQGAALTIAGHGFPFTGWIFLVALALAVACVVLLRPLEVPAFEGIVAVGLAAIGGYAFLLHTTYAPTNPWLGYYPTKFMWMLTIVFGAIALSLLMRLIVERLPFARARVGAVAVAGVATLLLATLGPTPIRDHYVIEQPLPRILAGHTWNTGESTAKVILAANRKDGTVVLWNSGDPDEAFINFWELDYRGAEVGGSDDARAFTVLAYRALRDHGSSTPGDTQRLCDLVPELVAPVSVYTQDDRLAEEVSTLCPTAGITVHNEPPPGSE